VTGQARWRELLALARHVPLIPSISTDVVEYGASDALTVFVHGYLSTGGAMRPLGEHLGHIGVAARQVHFTFGPTGSVAEVVRRLDDIIRRAQAGRDGAVRIVGHSLGGLVARYYRQVLGRPVERLVCIATPHGGVPRAAALRVLPLLDELAPGSSTLALLDATRARLAGTAVTCIAAADDALVPDGEGSRLTGVHRVRARDVGHLGVLFDREAWDAVADALRD
jgi:pimeloyl-ACP methyl ester carboxylesterase